MSPADRAYNALKKAKSALDYHHDRDRIRELENAHQDLLNDVISASRALRVAEGERYRRTRRITKLYA